MHSISYQGRIEATKKREHAVPAAEENEVATCKQGAYRFFAAHYSSLPVLTRSPSQAYLVEKIEKKLCQVYLAEKIERQEEAGGRRGAALTAV